MPSAAEVTHSDWSEVAIVYDDGANSAIWGRYKDGRKCLGVRYNTTASTDKGFPNARGYPVWYVEPQFIQEAVLMGLLNKLMSMASTPQTKDYLANVLVALREAKQQTS